MLLLYVAVAHGQAIDNTLSYKNIAKNNYFRISYENDYFSATDMYYTQGMVLELVSPGLRKSPMFNLLLTPIPGQRRYGASIEHDVYTPCSISSDAVLYGDRPFSACLFLKTFIVTTDTIAKRRFSSNFSYGVMGEAAGAEMLQTAVHNFMPRNSAPKGWANQIRNDFIINYQADYEQQLLCLENVFLVDAYGMARLGTLSNKAAVGATLMFGNFYSPYKSTLINTDEFRVYIYDHPQVNFVGYDATLQGGLFNKTSPYIIHADNLNRITFENRFGFAFSFHDLYFEYFQSYITSEFKSGKEHHWGGIQIAFGI